MSAEQEDVPKGEDIGLVQKYIVHKILEREPDGTVSKMQAIEESVFVLSPSTDPLARVALSRYAQEAYSHGKHKLAEDIYEWLKKEEIQQTLAKKVKEMEKKVKQDDSTSR